MRVDLKGSKPPIWRRLEVRSDLRLDVLHRVLQAAFDWTDSHLHRFSLGGDPFDPASQLFLCSWDAEEGESDDVGGIPADQVRLDETMGDPGDVLAYVYDYGDNWELTLRLEDVLPAAPDALAAVAVDGRRAAPPEDCGGLCDAESLAEVLDDPAHFDLGEVNSELRSGFIVLREHGVNRHLVDLIGRLSYSPVGEDLTARAMALMSGPTPPDDQVLLASLRPFTWFLDQAADEGIQLTEAGYLKPRDVQAVAQVLPTMDGWIGAANREHDTTPVLHFRQLVQSLGLLRKYKGALRLTRIGASAQASHELLWTTLADKLVPDDDGFDRQATLLLLVCAATSADAELPLEMITDTLTHLGWRTADGQPVERYDLYGLSAQQILASVSSERRGRGHSRRIGPPGAELARAALRRP
jgi:hypothetical protein